MDYGQNMQQSMASDSQPPFFTTGQGTNSNQVNDFEPEKNFDLTHQPEWGTINEASSDSEISGSEQNAIPSEQTIDPVQSETVIAYNNHHSPDNLGKVIELELPPGSESSTTGIDRTLDKAPATQSLHNVRTTGDKLETSGIREIDNVIERLSSNDDTADFYETVRGSNGNDGMVKSHLLNSFGKEDTAWKEVA